MVVGEILVDVVVMELVVDSGERGFVVGRRVGKCIAFKEIVPRMID